VKDLQNLFEGQWGKLMKNLVEGDLIRLLNGNYSGPLAKWQATHVI